MLNKLSHILKDGQKRLYLRVAAFAVLIGGVALVVFINWSMISGWFKPIIVIAPGPEITATGDIYSLPRALPTRLRIPEIKVDASFEAPLELEEDGTIEVPEGYDKVGWYKLGAAPGEIGTATILGHVDSYEGAEVFYLLGQLEPGDKVLVDREDGTTATFMVDKLERYSQNDFPAEKVYGMTDYPSLRLITCTGSYDHDQLRYSHNLVVYAHLVEPETTETEN